jgi:DNA primase
MYPMMLAGEPQERIAALNCVSLETARESNPIATCFAALFKAYRSRARSGPGEYVPH